jgi:hypothetical protein
LNAVIITDHEGKTPGSVLCGLVYASEYALLVIFHIYDAKKNPGRHTGYPENYGNPFFVSPKSTPIKLKSDRTLELGNKPAVLLLKNSTRENICLHLAPPPQTSPTTTHTSPLRAASCRQALAAVRPCASWSSPPAPSIPVRYLPCPSVSGQRPSHPHASPWPATPCRLAPAAVAASAYPRGGMDDDGVAGFSDLDPGTYAHTARTTRSSSTTLHTTDAAPILGGAFPNSLAAANVPCVLSASASSTEAGQKN